MYFLDFSLKIFVYIPQMLYLCNRKMWNRFPKVHSFLTYNES